MKKCFILFSTVLLAAFCGCSKWVGDPITQEFDIDGSYAELYVEDAFDVFVSDTVDKVIVTAGEKIMPKVIVKKSGDKLEIYLKGWNSNRGSDMKVILPYNAVLNKVDLNGASEFHSDYPLVAQKVVVALSGASDFFADIEAGNVEADLSGSSDINGNITATILNLEMSGSSDAAITGQVSSLNLSLSGASSIKKIIVGDQYALSCEECTGSLSGSSDGYIHCDGSISVSLSGSSDLHYTGRAATRGSSTSGSSDLVHDVL